MNILQALCLGVLQGITEFLPISSSGHLALAQHLFGLQEPQLFFDVAVHVATLMAVLLVFRADLLLMFTDCLKFLRGFRSAPLAPASTDSASGAQMAVMILVGSLPTAVVGLLLRDVFQRFFTSPAIVGLCLWITGFFLVLSRWSRQHRQQLDSPNVVDALVIGLAQGGAISPGVSRSGVTIVTGLLFGLRPDVAFRFSFLLSIPAILGALAFETFHLNGNYPEWHIVAVGSIAAFVVGLLALGLLRFLVERGKLFYFAPYCFALGTVALVIALF